ncbi:cysteine rich secretory protein LCCL [Echinococcus multilocularis]|uniref:Cysteine rich secretory protein LCCL n=1 Tax=Echinococcus multilocularis TaxID=6211 RepID=A0A068YNQ3_ECHMU|nr:cysteine rich secretory protein LCCL [Echinococcus multilocularis]
MAKFIYILFFATLVVSNTPSAKERKDLLHYHNHKRANVKPSATNMLEMVYSLKLERLADKWVKKCIYEHPNSTQYPEYRDYGQNLVLFGGESRNLVQMAAKWWEEVKDFSYERNKCAPRKVCHHYIQMVWSTSNELGCAVKRCDHLRPDWPPPVYLLACQYKPPGNYMGIKPYKDGRSCRDCPFGTKCMNRLCSTKSASSTRRFERLLLCAMLMVYYFL